MNASRRPKQGSSLDQAPFHFRATASGQVRIDYDNRTVTVLAGKQAGKFLKKAEQLDAAGQQLLMAKATGHFKHGNERPIK